MRTLLAALLVALSCAAHAESVSVVLVETSGTTEEVQRRVLRSASTALRELSGWSLKEVPPARRTAPRKDCVGDSACLAAAAAAPGTEHVLLLALTRTAEQVALEGFLADLRARKVSRHQRTDERGEEPEAVRALVEALLPAFARKGWGGLTLKVEPTAVVKIDGARYIVDPQDPFIALTAGPHEVDILLATGALLQTHQVREGERSVLSVPSAAMLPGIEGARGRSDALLFTSYGLGVAGALAIAGSLVAGGMAQAAARDVTPCVGGQACTSFEEAQVVLRRAEIRARNANILLGTGAVLSAAGAGVFAFDFIRSKESR